MTPLAQYFRCAEREPLYGGPASLAGDEGYFRFQGSVCYGRTIGGRTAREFEPCLPDAAGLMQFDNGAVILPFDLAEVLGNLREERYRRPRAEISSAWSSRMVESLYYFVRPLLAVPVRKHLQRIRLSDWKRIGFPGWPVDTSVEELMRTVLFYALKVRRTDRIPFIWFWPDAAQACVIVTHDVETPRGRDLCGPLMDLDDSYGVKSSFQVRPTALDAGFRRLVDEIRSRGFELNLHDIEHDGQLFRTRHDFLRRITLLNQWAKELGCRGFRSGVMCRNQAWYDAFEFSYDMSVPNVAHLEAQRGGCCTVMPYFIGDVLELPLTTTQDYTLFHILNERSTKLWERQIDAIVSQHGLVSVIAHPDYLRRTRERSVYESLLKHLSAVAIERQAWMALPGQVDEWWRDRQRMRLVSDGDSFRIEGPQSDRARLAYACIEDDRLVYRLEATRSVGTCE